MKKLSYIKRIKGKKYITLVIGIIIGIVVASTSVYYAATIYYDGINVGYDNSTSGFKDSNGNNVADVQTALDELYTLSESSGGGIDDNSIDFSTIKTNTAKTVLASSKGVCINRNGKLNCFKRNNREEEQNHIQQVFSDISCDVSSSHVNCDASDFDCDVSSNGVVYCGDYSDNSYCFVYADGSIKCT